MKRFAIAAAAAIAMLSTGAQAQTSPFYGEVGYTVLKFKAEGQPNLKPSALRGIVGYEFHPNLAVEGMLAFGVSNDDFNVDDGLGGVANVEVKLQHAYGIYVKPKFNVTPQFEVFGRLGYNRIKTKETDTAFGASESFSDSDGDFAYGLGAAYRFNPRMSVGLDYMRYFDKDGGKIDGVTVSFGYRF
jgi:outer membrane autotransporter protein